MSDNLVHKYIGLGNSNENSEIRMTFLDDCLFRFTQPTDLNDPYELIPAIRMGEYSREDWEIARDTCQKDYGTILPDQELKALYLTAYPSGRMDEKSFPCLGPHYDSALKEGPIKTMAEFDELKTEKVKRDFVSRLNATYGIFCLSETVQSPVMWAHYAAGHRGMAIGFDRSHEFFKKEDFFLPVEYMEERVSITNVDGIIRIGGIRNIEEFRVPLKLFLRKHHEWNYELELRIIKPLSQCSSKNLTSPEEFPIYLFPIPFSAIKTLTFGARMSDAEITRAINKVMTDPKWSHLQLIRAKLNPKNFNLDFEEVQA